MVATDMAQGHDRTPEQRAAMLATIPAGRIAEPSEIADLVVFLLGPSASYLNGAVVTADGGWTT